MRAKAIVVGVALAIAGLTSACQSVMQSGLPDPQLTERDKKMMALAEPDEWRIPTVRKLIEYQTSEKPGTIIVDTGPRNLYYVLPGGKAIQYRVATGAEAYGWTGRATRGRHEGMANLDADRLDHGALA